MNALEPLARAFINRFQGGFPLVERPFTQVAATLGCTEATLIQMLERLLEAGWLSRFGPLFDAARLGGGVTLAALAAPEDGFDTVAEQVNALPGVAHNYRRDHHLNMWFVVAAETPAGVTGTLREIGRRTGLPVYDFPRQREFYLGLWLRLAENGGIDTVPLPAEHIRIPVPFEADADDRRLIAATQAGLPLSVRPYADLARQLGLTQRGVMQRLRAMLDGGVIRRIGAVPQHYRLGLRGNGMTVWDVDDARAEAAGERLARLDFVSHCYLRPRHAGVWRYNLFAMIHGHDRAEVLARTARARAVLGDDCRAHEILFSRAVLKKTGLRLAA